MMGNITPTPTGWMFKIRNRALQKEKHRDKLLTLPKQADMMPPLSFTNSLKGEEEKRHDNDSYCTEEEYASLSG